MGLGALAGRARRPSEEANVDDAGHWWCYAEALRVYMYMTTIRICCTNVCIFTYIHIHRYVSLDRVYLQMHSWIYTIYIYIYIIYIHLHERTHTYMHTYICMYICMDGMHVCICTYTYVYMYMHIHGLSFRLFRSDTRSQTTIMFEPQANIFDPFRLLLQTAETHFFWVLTMFAA